MNRLDDVALITIFALRINNTGRTSGRTDPQLDGWSIGRSGSRLIGQAGSLATRPSSSTISHSNARRRSTTLYHVSKMYQKDQC